MVQDSCWICGADVLPEDNFCRLCGIKLTRGEAKIEANRPPRMYGRISLGVFLSTLGIVIGIMSYLMNIIPALALGFASFLIGVMVLYLPESGTIRESLAANSILASLLNIEKLLEDLDLDERGIYIPTTGLGISPKVFVPLIQTPTTERPPRGLTQSTRIFVSVGKNPEDRGILLDAPGSQIINDLEQTLHVDLANAQPQDLQSTLDKGLRGMGIGKMAKFELEGLSCTFSLELTALIELEEKLRNLAPRLVVQIGTPITSAVASAVSKATGKYVTLKSAMLDPRKNMISVSLKLTE